MMYTKAVRDAVDNKNCLTCYMYVLWKWCKQMFDGYTMLNSVQFLFACMYMSYMQAMFVKADAQMLEVVFIQHAKYIFALNYSHKHDFYEYSQVGRIKACTNLCVE